MNVAQQTPFEELGARIAWALESAAPERERALELARRVFLQRAIGRRKSGSRPSPATWASAGGLAVAALAAALVVVAHERSPLTFNVDGVAGSTKTWLAAPETAPVELGFSEGTKVRLAAASRARVAELDSHGATLALESGSLHVEVVHEAGSAWKVVAGPFTVSVTGTVLDVNWDPASQELAVSVSRGSVSVRDGKTGVERALHAPETLRAGAAEHGLELPPTSNEPLSPAAPSGAAAMLESAPPERSNADSRPALDNSGQPAAGRSEGSSSEWRAFAQRGALREAFSSAEAAGFARTCAEASPAELLLLGDGARLAGKPERAVEALLTLRRRYATDPRRAAAAFSLGKVAFDQRGAYEQAAEWFSTSLREQPGGPLAREASGRLIEALRRADDSAGARRAARSYLSKYPEGPHADLARSVLR